MSHTAIVKARKDKKPDHNVHDNNADIGEYIVVTHDASAFDIVVRKLSTHRQMRYSKKSRADPHEDGKKCKPDKELKTSEVSRWIKYEIDCND